jgi:hypothetical protein
VTRRVPAWLYERREDGLLRSRRWGSRRPLRVCLMILDDPPSKSHLQMAASYMFCIGRLGVQWGPEDGVSEGFTSMPRGSRCRLFSLRSGIGIGVTWEARG